MMRPGVCAAAWGDPPVDVPPEVGVVLATPGSVELVEPRVVVVDEPPVVPDSPPLVVLPAAWDDCWVDEAVVLPPFAAWIA